MGVAVAVDVALGVDVDVAVGVDVAVAVDVDVAIGVFVGVPVGVAVGDTVGDAVGVPVGDAVGDTVGVPVGVPVGEAVGVNVAVDVAVGVDVAVDVDVAVGVPPGVAVGDPGPGPACAVFAQLIASERANKRRMTDFVSAMTNSVLHLRIVDRQTRDVESRQDIFSLRHVVAPEGCGQRGHHPDHGSTERRHEKSQ